MRYFVFLDRSTHLAALATLVRAEDELTLVSVGAQTFDTPGRIGGRHHWNYFDPNRLPPLGILRDDRVIISSANTSLFAPLVEALSNQPRPPAILILSETEPEGYQPNVAQLDLVERNRQLIDAEWRVIATRGRVVWMQELMADRKKIAIVTQNDPDPDAIASGLALQALLGRNRKTAPLVTFGAVTRSENRAMIRLIKTEVRRITPDELSSFDAIAMVDVQPPYFAEGLFATVDLVIDHHPYPDTYSATFIERDPEVGATCTIMYEYLTAAGVAISKRLATALLYGVITDTAYLSRDTTQRDFDAFSALWPKTNIPMLGAMSRPRLTTEELAYFVQAIQGHIQIGDMTFVWLGLLSREDIIPRLADFTLTFGDFHWSAVGGLYEGNIVISFRYLGNEKNAGELAADLFSPYGSAGGHKGMAKAVIPLEPFKETFGLANPGLVKQKIADMLAADDRLTL